MFTVIASGWIVILVGALVVAWRGRRARAGSLAQLPQLEECDPLFPMV
jgi:hypothetical protein